MADSGFMIEIPLIILVSSTNGAICRPQPEKAGQRHDRKTQTMKLENEQVFILVWPYDINALLWSQCELKRVLDHAPVTV